KPKNPKPEFVVFCSNIWVKINRGSSCFGRRAGSVWASQSDSAGVTQKAGGDFLSASAGLLGPTLRAEVGDTVVVTFRNMASGAHSIHPHGVAYGKQSEGAHYFDNTSQKEKEDDVVPPGGQHVYSWEVQQDVSPQAGDPACLTYSYVSHQHVVEDFNSGLIGALLVCKAGSLDESGMQVGVQHELVFLFGVFDEAASRFRPGDYSSDGHVKYTINGYSKGALPGRCERTHGSHTDQFHFTILLGFNTFSVKFYTSNFGAGATAAMVAVHAGRWLLSSHVAKHMESESRWKYYIAAEEVTWDYAPDVDFKLQYLTRSATRIGSKYKKAVYSLYTNESFSERLETRKRRDELGILGPVIRAQIRDIVFKNMASRPYSIYPHGLTIEKSEEGVNYPDGGNHSHGVLPGETHTYVWRVVEEDEPLPGDSRCLTRVYHSAVDTPRDIASGLIGPILICKSQSLNVRNLKADKEQHAMFAVFDENKSWYLEDNIRQYCDRSKVHQADSDFYKSNVMHTINGYSFETGPLLGFCNGEVATWHVSSIGPEHGLPVNSSHIVSFLTTATLENVTRMLPEMESSINATLEVLRSHLWENKENETGFLYRLTHTSPTGGKTNLNLDETAKYYLKLSGPNVKTYFIAAEEVEWDYAEKTQQQKRETKFTKVVFRGYLDASFNTPDIRGEIDEHLGILGPVIKAEVGQNIMVVFKNKASRPYSLHPNGVQPNTTFTYLWKVGESVGPKPEESDCRTWAYYSGVNPERDIHSGLIGPLLVCKKGTMEKKSLNTREFMLLFMTFDESQSWYYMENREIFIFFHVVSIAINGIIHSLKGLRMYAKQLAYWHLINMGPPKDVHTVHFHGQTFIHKKTSSHRQAVFPLLPGSFATLEMYPSRPGLWQLETEVGLNQQRGMQTLFLVLDDGDTGSLILPD
uniref:Coagulation factor V n=1 Tax=Salarias fasciatus TaxID=181472 RepID=A0A672ICR2_SALFA